MKFKYSTVIYKNTSDLIKKLEELGYKRTGNYYEEDCYIYTTQDGYYRSGYSLDYKDEKPIYIFCGSNSELFLAIAAMREDSDKFQYFVRNKDLSLVNQGIYAPKGSFSYSLVDEFPNQDNEYHKANLEEIIKYFK